MESKEIALKNIGTFSNIFSSFSEGINSLRSVSESVTQSIKYATQDDEISVVCAMSTNVVWDRPTGNGVDWGRVRLTFLEGSVGVHYVTTGGLVYGWIVDRSDFWEKREEDPSVDGENSWTFFIVHPKGEDIPEDSTLRQSAMSEGWEEGVEAY